MVEKVAAAVRKVADQVDRGADELSFSEREQHVLALALDNEVVSEVDLTWPTHGETRATQPQCQILKLRQQPCFLDSGKNK